MFISRELIKLSYIYIPEDMKLLKELNIDNIKYSYE